MTAFSPIERFVLRHKGVVCWCDAPHGKDSRQLLWHRKLEALASATKIDVNHFFRVTKSSEILIAQSLPPSLMVFIGGVSDDSLPDLALERWNMMCGQTSGLVAQNAICYRDEFTLAACLAIYRREREQNRSARNA
jgi:hypothetical protein